MFHKVVVTLIGFALAAGAVQVIAGAIQREAEERHFKQWRKAQVVKCVKAGGAYEMHVDTLFTCILPNGRRAYTEYKGN